LAASLMNPPDQIATLFSVTLMFAAFGAVLCAFWRRKKSRWVALILGIVSVFIVPTAALIAVLVAILGKIDESKMNSNKKLELLMWSVTGAVFVICLTLTDFRVIPFWLTVGITIASLAVKGLIGCFIMWCFLGPTRYLEFIQKATAEQNEVLATQALRREDKRKRRGQK
jgi:ABC-type proline/glycine betaine transport system permease subunit